MTFGTVEAYYIMPIMRGSSVLSRTALSVGCVLHCMLDNGYDRWGCEGMTAIVPTVIFFIARNRDTMSTLKGYFVFSILFHSRLINEVR